MLFLQNTSSKEFSLQVHLPQEDLDRFLQVAKFMRIRGLVKVGEDDDVGGGGGGQPMTRTRTSTETEGSRKRGMSFGDDFDDQDDLVNNYSECFPFFCPEAG